MPRSASPLSAIFSPDAVQCMKQTSSLSPATGSPPPKHGERDSRTITRRTRSPLSDLPRSVQRCRLPADDEAAPESIDKRKKALSRWPSSARWSSFNLGGGGRALNLGFGDDDCGGGFAISRKDSESERSALESTRRSSSSLIRRNSLVETKMLFARSGMRTSSFVIRDDTASVDEMAAAGEDATLHEPCSEFLFHEHFVWLNKLGTGSFADVWLVRHKRRPTEQYAVRAPEPQHSTARSHAPVQAPSPHTARADCSTLHVVRVSRLPQVKCFKGEFKSRTERAERLREAEIANQLAPHPNVISYYRVWQDMSMMYVQMELCEHGSLREQLAATPLCTPAGDAAAWHVVRHVAAGLAHVHAHGMLHCDVKPDNILLARACGKVVYKLGDLGQATFVSNWDDANEGDARCASTAAEPSPRAAAALPVAQPSRALLATATPLSRPANPPLNSACRRAFHRYLARDLLQSTPSPAADIFSFGVTMLEAKSGVDPPGHGDAWEALRSGAPIALTRPTHTSDAKLVELIQSMLATEPMSRPTAAAVGAECPIDASLASSLPLVSPRLMTPRSALFLARRGKLVMRWLLGGAANGAKAEAMAATAGA